MPMPREYIWWQFLHQHPEQVIEATNRFPVAPNRIMVELRIRGETPRDWTGELRAIRGVLSAQRLDRSGRPDMYRVLWKAPHYYGALLEKYDLVGLIPFHLRAGQVEFTVALPRDRLRQLVVELRRRHFAPEVLEVRPLRGHTVLGDLTPKQRERFQTAVASGFFDVPRRVSLGELARRFSVRKSALSESLAHARRKVLEAAGRAMTSNDEDARRAFFGPA
jgi:predicted DNA binding protein